MCSGQCEVWHVYYIIWCILLYYIILYYIIFSYILYYIILYCEGEEDYGGEVNNWLETWKGRSHNLIILDIFLESKQAISFIFLVYNWSWRLWLWTYDPDMANKITITITMMTSWNLHEDWNIAQDKIEMKMKTHILY